jgi:hypothetical protein
MPDDEYAEFDDDDRAAELEEWYRRHLTPAERRDMPRLPWRREVETIDPEPFL